MSNGGIHSYLAEKESTAINYSKNPYSSNSAVSSSTAIDKHRNSIQQRIANLEAKILNKTNPHPSSNRNSLYESNKEPKASQLQSISSQYIKNQGTGSFNNLNDHMLNNHLSAYKAPSSVSNPYISYGDSFFANINNLAQPFQQVSLRQQPQQKSHIYNTHHPHNTSNQALVAQNKLQRDGRSKRSLTSSVNTQIDHKKGINPNNNVNRSRSKSPKRQYSKSKFQMLHGRDQDYPTRKELIKENTGNQIKKQTAQQNYQQRSSITHKSSSKQPIQKGSNQDYQKLSKPSPQLLEQNFIQLNKTISNLRTLSNNGPVNLSFNSTQPLRNSVNHPLRNSRQHHLGNSVNQPFFNPPHGSNLNNVQLYEMMKSILAGQQRLEKELQMIKQKQNSKKNQSSTKYTNGDQKQQEAKDNYQQKKLRHQNKQNIIHGQNSRGRTQKKDVSPRNIGKSHLGLRERSRSAKNCDQSAIDSPVKLRKSKSPLNQSHQNRSKSPHNNKQLSRRKSNVKRVAQNLSQATGHNSTSGNVRNCQGKQVGKISKNKQRFYQLYKMAQQNRRLNPSSGVSVSEDSLSSTWQKVRRVIERSQAQNVETSKISHQNNRYINDHLVNTIQLQRKLKKDLTKKIYDMCQNKCLFK